MLLKLSLIATFAIEVLALKNLLVSPFSPQLGDLVTATWEGESGDGDIVQLQWVRLGKPPADTRFPTGVSFGAGTYNISAKIANTTVPNTIQAHGTQHTIVAFIPATNKSVESNIIEITSGPRTTFTVNGSTFTQDIPQTVEAPTSSPSEFITASTATLQSINSISVTITTTPTDSTSGISVFTSISVLSTPSVLPGSAASSTGSASASATPSVQASSSSGRTLPWSKVHWVVFVVSTGLLCTL